MRFSILGTGQGAGQLAGAGPGLGRGRMLNRDAGRGCRGTLLLLIAMIALCSPSAVWGQEESVRPGINDAFLDADPASYVERFEKEGREVYDQRHVIVQVSGVRPGMVVADIGAGTGLFTRLFSRQVGAEGRVFAVDIAPNFVYQLVRDSRRQGIENIVGVICDERSCHLPPNSVDLVFICDTYHHFEFPYATLESIHQALRDDGRLMVVDFQREEGISSEWILNHVRAGRAVFQSEIEEAGFQLVEETDFLRENYGLIFRKVPGD